MVLVWLSGNYSCPVSGENERIMVSPHLGSYSMLEVSVPCPPEFFPLGMNAPCKSPARARKEEACQMGS